MNERIKELADRAWVYQMTVYEDNGVRTFGEREQVFSKEKFAELIVKECVQVAHPKLTDVGERAAGMRQVQKRLKEHFGVEL